MCVAEALDYFTENEANRLVNRDKVVEYARISVENNGIIFIDEIDKIATSDRNSGIDVSRSGVQRICCLCRGLHCATSMARSILRIPLHSAEHFIQPNPAI